MFRIPLADEWGWPVFSDEDDVGLDLWCADGRAHGQVWVHELATELGGQEDGCSDDAIRISFAVGRCATLRGEIEGALRGRDGSLPRRSH